MYAKELITQRRGEKMQSIQRQTVESIFYYELHRKQLIKELKNEFNLRFNDLLFLQHILSYKRSSIPLLEVKKGMNFSLMEIHKSFSTLTEMNILGKQRCTDDERQVFVTISKAQEQQAEKLLESFNELQMSVLQGSVE